MELLIHLSYNFAGGHIAGLLGLVPGMVLYVASAGLVLIAVSAVVYAGPKYLSRWPVSELPTEPAEVAERPQVTGRARPSTVRP